MFASKGNKGLATPVTMLILLSSFTILTMTTYYSAMSSINTKTGTLNYSAAKQEMLELDSTILSLARSPGSAQILSFQGHEEFKIKPGLRSMVLNITLGSFREVIFNSSLGRIEYELPSTDIAEGGSFLNGDARAIVNQSNAGMSQTYITNDGDLQKVYLGYRPLATSYIEKSESNVTNVIRIYVINLNSSKNLTFQGDFRTRIYSVNVTCETRVCSLPYQASTAVVKASINGDSDTVTFPISSNLNSTIVRTEIMIFNVRLEEVN